MGISESERLSRREVLKAAALAGAAAVVGPTILSRRRGEVYAAGAPTHPAINPLRVVGIHDPHMTAEEKVQTQLAEQDAIVRAEVVRANLDKLACALAGEKEPKAAWGRIFLKPPRKSWSEVVVAIKTNQIAQQRTRSAVMASVCHVLVGLGVKPTQIFIYDACHGNSMNPYAGVPEGVVFAKQWGGSVTPVPLPPPYKEGKAEAKCLKHLADGTVDILVNIALCKGHNDAHGKFTMCLKNHYGTFEPHCRWGTRETRGPAADYLISINRTPQILGEIDAASGKVLFPRQQLCLIDALWASQPGPGGLPTAQPNRIFMGTSAAVVDYVVATDFRRDTMGWRINDEVAEHILKEFGLTPGDLPNQGKVMQVAA